MDLKLSNAEKSAKADKRSALIKTILADMRYSILPLVVMTVLVFIFVCCALRFATAPQSLMSTPWGIFCISMVLFFSGLILVTVLVVYTIISEEFRRNHERLMRRYSEIDKKLELRLEHIRETRSYNG